MGLVVGETQVSEDCRSELRALCLPWLLPNGLYESPNLKILRFEYPLRHNTTHKVTLLQALTLVRFVAITINASTAT